MGLKLSRTPGQAIVLEINNEETVIDVRRVRGSNVTLEVDAPDNVRILRRQGRQEKPIDIELQDVLAWLRSNPGKVELAAGQQVYRFDLLQDGKISIVTS